MVPGMLSALMGYNFVTNCIGREVEGNTAKAQREIDGGIESVSCQLPLVIGAQKGLVEEKDLIIPNMRGIMQARTKPLHVKQTENLNTMSQTLRYEKPAPKQAVTLVENAEQLINLLHNEAKVI